MSTRRKKTNPGKIQRALANLELLSDEQNQKVLRKLDDGQAHHLSDLSRHCKQAPSKTKKQLDKLKDAGLVFPSKRNSLAYASNKVKLVKINLGIKKCIR